MIRAVFRVTGKEHQNNIINAMLVFSPFAIWVVKELCYFLLKIHVLKLAMREFSSGNLRT